MTTSISPRWIRPGMGGSEGDFDQDEATVTLASSIESLQIRQSRQWPDRLWESSAHVW